MAEIESPDSSKAQSSNRNVYIGLAIIAGVLVLLLVVIAIIFVLFDPFDLIARLRGRYDPIAGALPPDTAFYVNMNLQKLTTNETNRIIDAFAEAVDKAEIDDTTSLLRELDDSLQESLNLTFSDDIQPWIGQFVGLSIDGLGFDYSADSIPDVIFLVEVRNRRKADDFIEKLIVELEEDEEVTLSQIEYLGTSFYELRSEDEFENIAFGRSKNLLILASSMDLVRESIDASRGDSFADTPTYEESTSGLPTDRALTVLISPIIFETMQSTSEELFPEFNLYQSPQLEAFRWMSTAISTTEDGIQLDFLIAYDEEFLSSDQVSIFEGGGIESRLAKYYPQETLFYLIGARLDLIWQNLREVMIGSTGSAEFEESMDLFKEEFGFNPDEELFPLFNGVWSIGLYHTQAGMIADEIDVPLGLMIMIETSDDARMQHILEEMISVVEILGVGVARQRQSDELIFYDLEEPYAEMDIFTIGAGKGFFLLGTDSKTLDELFTRDPSLLDNVNFARAFQGEKRPVLFLDLHSLFDLVEEDYRMVGDAQGIKDLEILRPMSFIAASSMPYRDGVVQSTIVLYIESE